MTGAVVALASMAPPFQGSAPPRRLRVAQVRTGGRATHWGRDIIQNYAGLVRIVGLRAAARAREFPLQTFL